MKNALRGQASYIYREIRRRHQWGYKLLHAQASQPGSKKRNPGVCLIQWRKKRQAQQMITVPMRQKQRKVEFCLPSFPRQKIFSQTNNATASIQDQGMSTDLNLYTTGIASITHCR